MSENAPSDGQPVILAADDDPDIRELVDLPARALWLHRAPGRGR
jgi:hypothetical protein